jgi:hypothetical protein
VGSGDASFYAINPDGTKKWRKYIGLVADSSAAIAPDGTIYFGAGIVGGPGAFYALSPNGDTLWHMDLPGAIRSSPALAQDGTVYFGCADGTMYAVGRDGNVIWQHKVSQSILSSPALGADGSVVAGSDDGRVYCFRDTSAGDTTPPTTPAVTIDREILTPGMTIYCSWTASDPESGIQYYSYAVGTQPGYDDAVAWTNIGSSTSTVLQSLQLEQGRSYYVSVAATNWASLTSGAGASQPFTIVSTAADNAIGWAKQRSDGTAVHLQGKVVTAVFEDCVYIEELTRASGIRCAIFGSSLKPGAIVDVSGAMGTRYNERVVNSPVLNDTGLKGEVKPFYMPGDFSTRPGIDPTGLLVRVFGRVTRSGEGWYVISDGTYIMSPRGAQGIEVRMIDPASSGMPLGTYVTITGVAGCELSNSRIATIVRSVEDSSPATAIAGAE